MARYNTVVSSTINTGTVTTIPAPGTGQFTEFTGVGGYTITLPDPTLYLGTTQTFWNNTSSSVSLVTPTAGQYFKGPGQTGSSNTYVLGSGNTTILASDGNTYAVVLGSGGPVSATTLTASSTVTLSPSGASVTISPTGGLTVAPTTVAGTMDNVSVGATTASTGRFTTLVTTSTTQGTLATSGQSVLIGGGVGVNGTIYTVGLVETSSIAFKENVQPLVNPLDKVLSMMGVTYDRKDGHKQSEVGLIAEDVYKIAPELVTLDEHGKPYGIQYTKVTAFLIESVKALKAELDFLKGKK
jgi:Chaperone of endosialidase